MKNKKHYFSALFLTLTTSLLPCTQVNATNVEPYIHGYVPCVIDEYNFNYTDYANRYPDLANAFGLDKKSLYKHYVTAGKEEGRFVQIPKSAYIDDFTFDSDRYINDNPDIVAAIGSDPSKLYNHYRKLGSSEGRRVYGHNDNINARLKVYDVIDEIIPQGCTDEEKVRLVHDWIINNTTYGFGDNNYCFDVSGPMLYGESVCQGYALTFKAFMDALGIENEFVAGRAFNGYSTGGHGWNRVKLNGNWYNIDVTWDDPISSSGPLLKYDYYLISDSQMAIDHFAEEYGNN